MIPLLIANWKTAAIGILAALALLFFGFWQSAREDVGEWKAKYETEERTKKAFKFQLDEANARIGATAKDGAKSYGQCQDLAATSSAKAFDKGVLFGRATCGAK